MKRLAHTREQASAHTYSIGRDARARVRQSRSETRARAAHVPEYLHIDIRLEHNKEVGGVVRVDLGTAVAQVLWAVRAVEPLAADVRHAPVADRELVREVVEVAWNADVSALVRAHRML